LELIMTDLEIRRGPGRPPLTPKAPSSAPPARADETKAVRRRRFDTGVSSHLRLSIPEHMKNDSHYRYHWIADRPGRIENKTVHDDWDFVESSELAADGRQTGAGTRIERHAGVDQFGKPLRFFLCKKLKEHDEADKRREKLRLDEMMQQIKRGETPGKDAATPGHDGSYVPEAGITIKENYQP
jgi:hypothetical protein